jgi:hypothetical protein
MLGLLFSTLVAIALLSIGFHIAMRIRLLRMDASSCAGQILTGSPALSQLSGRAFGNEWTSARPKGLEER